MLSRFLTSCSSIREAHFNTLISCFIRSQLQTQALRLSLGYKSRIKSPQRNIYGMVKQHKHFWSDLWYNIMNKDIYISQNCSEGCVKPHRLDKSHKTMDLKRFKNRIREFLSEDDEYWIPAFEKIQQIENILKDFRVQVQKTIADKKLLYSLNYDTDGIFLKILTNANNDQFNKLTCQDAALIQNRINKGRNSNSAHVKNLVSDILRQASEKLKEKIDRVLNDKPGTELNRRKDERQVRRERAPRQQYQRPERGQRQERPRPYQKGNQEESKSQAPKIRENGLPTIKMKDVPQTDTHFNIQVKIKQIRKVFTLGPANKKKIQFQGGDETGASSIVVDAFKFIKAGNVIHISNAKIYSFHGTKQIQQNLKGSFVTDMLGVEMKVSDNNIFGQRRPRIRRTEVEQRQKSEQNKEQQQSNNSQLEYQRRRAVRQAKQDRARVVNYRRQRPEPYLEQKREFRRREKSRSLQNNVQIDTRRSDKRPIRREQESKRYSSSSSVKSSSQQPQKPKKQQTIATISKKKPTKIADLQPGEQNLNIVAEIVSIQPQSDLVSSSFLLCEIGDQTGVVLAELPHHHPDIKTNVVLFLQSVEAAVHETKKIMIIKVKRQSMIKRTTIRMPNINLQMNMSEQLWESEEQQDQQQEQEDERHVNPKKDSNLRSENNVEDF